MMLLAKFEKFAEKVFTGVFKKQAKPLQPVEIAKLLAREMQKYKRVSVSAVYVPNVFKVYLNPQDWSGIGSFATAFSQELSKYLYQQGQAGGYTFLSQPLVELEPGTNLERGGIEVVCEFDESIADLPETEEVPAEEKKAEEKKEETLILPLKSFPRKLQASGSGHILEVVEGPNAGKRFPLSNSSIFIGRQAECELVLDDTKVSRRHAALACRDGVFYLDDLGSTNGTFVNGRRIGRTKITAGDRVAMGNSVLELRVI